VSSPLSRSPIARNPNGDEARAMSTIHHPGGATRRLVAAARAIARVRLRGPAELLPGRPDQAERLAERVLCRRDQLFGRIALDRDADKRRDRLRKGLSDAHLTFRRGHLSRSGGEVGDGRGAPDACTASLAPADVRIDPSRRVSRPNLVHHAHGSRTQAPAVDVAMRSAFVFRSSDVWITTPNAGAA
jgi:hypothetical protein